MTWRDDGHGIVCRPTEVKLFGHSHTWAMKLSQLARQSGTVRIVTYSLPDLDYIAEQIARRPSDIYLLAHSKFVASAWKVRLRFPDIAVAVIDELHSKVVTIAPSTVYVSSANFGRSGWDETGIGIRSTVAHDWYVRHFDSLWERARVLERPER